MTDLIAVLPGFPTHQYVRLLPSLERHQVTTADLLTQDCTEIAKRASLPVLDVKRLCNAVLDALQASLGVQEDGNTVQGSSLLRKSGENVVNCWNTVSTLDDDLDRALGGGIPTGHITEVTGESGVGKTQFLLTLLLAAQLSAPQGLSSNVLYISTESALPTSRLSQLLRTHPVLLAADPKPTLDSVISIVTPDLESQDHILRFQVPVAVKRHGIRLIILDSIAANYRAEFERPGGGAASGQKSGANMAQRSSELVKLGQLLRELAREQNIAIVVANQVADRFSGAGGGNSPVLRRSTQSSPLARRSVPREAMPDSSIGPLSSIPMGTDTGNTPFRSTMDPMSLDHQQRWFTGWGDDPYPSQLALKNLKTPSLGLIWTTQISCRIALIKRPVYGPGLVADEENERGEPVLRKWRRWMKVVFAPHAAPSGLGVQDAVEFEIKGEGLAAVKKKKAFLSLLRFCGVSQIGSASILTESLLLGKFGRSTSFFGYLILLSYRSNHQVIESSSRQPPNPSSFPNNPLEIPHPPLPSLLPLPLHQHPQNLQTLQIPDHPPHVRRPIQDTHTSQPNHQPIQRNCLLLPPLHPPLQRPCHLLHNTTLQQTRIPTQRPKTLEHNPLLPTEPPQFNLVPRPAIKAILAERRERERRVESLRVLREGLQDGEGGVGDA